MEFTPSDIAYVIGASITVGIPALVTLWLQLRSHRVLTKNHHSSKKPTIPDRLDDLQNTVNELNQLVIMHMIDHENYKREK